MIYQHTDLPTLITTVYAEKNRRRRREESIQAARLIARELIPFIAN